MEAPDNPGMRTLTDAEEKWFRMKHPELSRAQQNAEIAKGLPADVPPITKEDLAARPAPAIFPPAFSDTEWDRRRRARKASAASKKRNRTKRHKERHHAKRNKG